MKFDMAPKMKQENTLPSAPESIPKPEAVRSVEQMRSNIINQAQEGRAKILRKTCERITGYVDEHIPPVAKKTVKSALDLTIVGNYERGKTALSGKDLSGEIVSNQQRILSGLVVTSSVLFYALVGYGTVEGSSDAMQASAVTYAASIPLLIAQMSPKLIANMRGVAEAAQKQKLVNFIDRMESIFEKVGYEKVRDVATHYKPETEEAVYA